MKKIHIVTISACLIFLGVIGFMILASKGSSSGSESGNLLKEISQAIEDKNIPAASQLYKQALENLSDSNVLEKARAKIEEASIKSIFSSSLNECSVIYVVQPKDVLSKIAKKFKTTVALIKRANNLKTDVIRPKQKLKVNICAFSIVVDKSQNLLFLKQKQEVIKTYIVSTGKANSTPTGNFRIINKLANPTWYKTGAVIAPNSPENILGTRWLGFDSKGYGIHGTTEPEMLGRQITLGCVRMKNEDVEELFDIVPVGTEVIIVD
ncbi:MAG: L,D-transpeptidase family protein [Candidatus Omnitrophica bacterium]|nr:L,D-transpeptidase family protein [Candidatus Omnitrophota bacterium]